MWGFKQYLWLDIPVKDLAIVYVFDSQTYLHKPVKYLQEEETGRDGTVRYGTVLMCNPKKNRIVY